MGDSTSAPREKQVTRESLPAWKWTGSIAVMFLNTLISGYDVSNVANIQIRLYEQFGNIRLLPWIGLSYSLANFAALSLSRKVLHCFDMRWIFIANLVIFMAGAALAGAAPNMSSVIVGRIIMGLSGAMVYQCNLTYVAIFATPTEAPRLFSLLSALWAAGLVVGGPVGSALATNSHTTWRWAFYMNLPWVGLSLVLAVVCIPSKYLGPDLPLSSRVTQIDPLGILLNMATPVLFAIALEFSGPIWDWGSGPSIALWVLFGVAVIAWIVQQYACIGTTPQQRAIPVHLLCRRDLLPIWIASGTAGASYAVTLYYAPLFFSFVRGHGPLGQTVRLLPFILVFIAVIILVGGLLPVLGRYNLIYIFAGMATTAGAAAMASTLSPHVSESQVLGLEAIIGVGLGACFQHGVGIGNVIATTAQDRVDSAILFNIAQLGGISTVLAVAGSIFQNVGYGLLVDAIGDRGFSENDLREALAGVSSAVWGSSDPEVMRKGVEAVAEVIAREFYLVVAGGVVCLLCGLVMKREKLDYKRNKAEGTA